MASQYKEDWQVNRKSVLERNTHMFNNPLMSDIMFTCGKSYKKFYAHKYVLATSSPVFYAMFYGDLAERSDVIHLCDADDKSLEEFFRFLYTDQCTPSPEIAVKTLHLAKKYIVPSLTEKCVEIIEESIQPDNVLTVLEQALYFDEKNLEKKCWEVVELQTSRVVTSEVFNNISQATLKYLLKRKRLNVPEVELFKAVLQWSDHQCSMKGLEATAENKRAVVRDAVYEICFLSMTEKEFAQYVPQSGLLTLEEIVPIYTKFNGFDVPALKWDIPIRRDKPLFRFSRFPVETIQDCSWTYVGECDGLSFSVSTNTLFHGVRLFGDDKGSEYEVSLDVNGVIVTGTFTSDCNNEGVYGFDVMMPTPIAVNKNDIVRMITTINGPSSFFGTAGEDSVEVGGVTLTFSDPSEEVSPNGTDADTGQFYEVFLSSNWTCEYNEAISES